MLRKRLRTQPSSMTNVLLRVLLGDSPCLCLSVLSQVRPPTGEPDAGDPPVRFGGRGNRIQSVLPTPIRSRLSRRLPCGEGARGTREGAPGTGGEGSRSCLVGDRDGTIAIRPL